MTSKHMKWNFIINYDLLYKLINYIIHIQDTTTYMI
jgi:hypothetical protein